VTRYSQWTNEFSKVKVQWT